MPLGQTQLEPDLTLPPEQTHCPEEEDARFGHPEHPQVFGSKEPGTPVVELGASHFAFAVVVLPLHSHWLSVLFHVFPVVEHEHAHVLVFNVPLPLHPAEIAALHVHVLAFASQVLVLPQLQIPLVSVPPFGQLQEPPVDTP